MEKVIVVPEVDTFLKELIDILFEQEYFSYRSNAIKYVDTLILTIKQDIKNKRHKTTPVALLHYGDFYSSFRVNNNTSWYAFFNKRNDVFVIKHITHNHHPDAAMLEGL